MKKYLALIVVIVMLIFAVSCFAEEVYKPGKNSSGQIGTSSRYWRLGYFSNLYGTTVITADPNIIQSVASKDWADASGTWTLSSTEGKAAIIYNQNTSVASWIIVAPSEQRIYTVYNNGAAAGTFKKSGGTGVSIPAYGICQVAYFTVGSTTDYHMIGSAPAAVVPTADRL